MVVSRFFVFMESRCYKWSAHAAAAETLPAPPPAHVALAPALSAAYPRRIPSPHTLAAFIYRIAQGQAQRERGSSSERSSVRKRGRSFDCICSFDCLTSIGDPRRAEADRSRSIPVDSCGLVDAVCETLCALAGPLVLCPHGTRELRDASGRVGLLGLGARPVVPI